ncbi:hypothetical protein [Bacillus mojavensis]|uniref:hypothetical protein n=1 Tax=Bacillus mojavensis TaxID=72360 RepID=UPI002DB706E8|nr:hypothetical protein [Bacillus mojavensis]
MSRHLRILAKAGLVHSRTKGKLRIYSLQAQPFQVLRFTSSCPNCHAMLHKNKPVFHG